MTGGGALLSVAVLFRSLCGCEAAPIECGLPGIVWILIGLVESAIGSVDVPFF